MPEETQQPGARRSVRLAPSIGHALCATVLAATPAPVFTQDIQVGGRPVETQADGPCLDLLTTGTQRYVNCNNGTVYDTVTNLVWLQDAGCVDLGTNGFDVWVDAQRDVEDLVHGLCNLSDHSQPGDWRLPTTAEWEATVEYARDGLFCVGMGAGGPPSLTDDVGDACFGTGTGSSFDNVANASYWSANSTEVDPFRAEVMSLVFGQMFGTSKSDVLETRGIWPVREGGNPGTTGTVVEEGATVETQADRPCYDGATTGTQRYVDCGDGTVLDLFTRLLWLANANCLDLAGLDSLGRANWPTAMAAAAVLAEPVCGLADGSQPGDWRLATPEEWALTVQRAQDLSCFLAFDKNPALTDNTGTQCLVDGETSFSNTSDFFFWTSQIRLSTGEAEFVTLATGTILDTTKLQHNFVWPIREWN